MGLGPDPGEATPPSERRRRILAELASLRDPQARLQWAVDRARQRPSLPDALRTEDRRVSGCQVRLWWVATLRGGAWALASDSDAATLKAMTGLLAECYDGETSQGILDDPPEFLEQLGLLRLLAENRRATVLRVAHGLVEAARAGVQASHPR